MKRTFRDDRLQARFERDGFVVTRLLSPREVERTLAGVERILPRLDARPVGLKSSYHVSLVDPDPAYRRKARALAEAALDKPLSRLLERYRFLTGGIIAKAAGAGEVRIHRDWTMTVDRQDVAINCWCPLVDVAEANGALCLLAGSHDLVPNIEAPRVTPFFAEYGEGLKPLTRCVELAAGEAVLFDYRILHWSMANRSDRVRAVITGGFIPCGARAVLYRPTIGGSRFEMIEPADSDWIGAVAEGLDGVWPGAGIVGSIPNDNQAIALPEFVRLLTLRQSGYAKGIEPGDGCSRIT